LRDDIDLEEKVLKKTEQLGKQRLPSSHVKIHTKHAKKDGLFSGAVLCQSLSVEKRSVGPK
jgi:hypothetical protein